VKIGIIGGGFYGCYIAKKLSLKHKVTIIDKNASILMEAAKYNQYRLHQGYHYPRSEETIKQTFLGYKKFKKEFKEFIYFPKQNYYLIHKNSQLSFKKYLKKYKNFKYELVNPKNIKLLKNPNNYLGCINTKEGVILLKKLLPKLKEKLHKCCSIRTNIKIEKIDPERGIAKDHKGKEFFFDLIINATYTNPNLGLDISDLFHIKYELASLLIPNTKIFNVPGITIMDGNFISLYPRDKNTFSISSVKYTPIKKFMSKSKFSSFFEQIRKKSFQKEIKKKIFLDAQEYLNLNLDFENSNLEFAFKTKFKDDVNDIRTANIKFNKKVISILSGKLDAAPDITDQIINYLKKNF
jgi:hypothetical protein